MYTYTISNEERSLDISTICNSSTLVITNALCKTSWKSTTQTMDVEVVGSRDKKKYRELVSLLLSSANENRRLTINVMDGDKTLFYGFVDISSLKIESAKIPTTLSLSAEDNSIDLDKKPQRNYTVENSLARDIVVNLLKWAEVIGKYDILGRDDTYENTIVDYFVITSEDNKTYRQIIDTLLFEMGGYVLYHNLETRKYEIRKILKSDTAQNHRTVRYLMSNGLKSSYKDFEEDGVAIKYPTVSIMENALVYSENINIEYNKEADRFIGLKIPSQTFYPENGERVATFQNFKKDLLDKPYQEGTSSLQNSDLDLLYVKEKDFKLEISTAEGTSEYLTQPAVELIKKPEGLQLYPRKAWMLLYNTSDASVNVMSIGMRGTAVYKSAKNTLVTPSLCQNPKEYETSYIFTEQQALRFAKFYYNYQRLSQATTTWSEKEPISSIGEIVFVKHPETDIIQKYVIVSIEVEGKGPTTKYNIVGVSCSEFDLEDFTLDSQIYPNGNNYPYETESVVLYAGTKTNEQPAYEDITLLNYPEWTNDINYIWCYTRTTWSNGRVSNGPITCLAIKGSSSDLTLEGLPEVVDYYADGVIKSQDKITITARCGKQTDKIRIKINNDEVVASDTNEASYEFNLSYYFDRMDEITVSLYSSNNRERRDFKAVKNKLKGDLIFTLSSPVMQFYADDVPYADSDVEVTVKGVNYSLAPILKIDNTAVALTNDTYIIKSSYLIGKKGATAVAEIPSYEKKTLTVSKIMDEGYLKLFADKTLFEFYADNVAHNGSDSGTLKMEYKGFSKVPTLKRNNFTIPYTEVGIPYQAVDVINTDLTFVAEIAEYRDTLVVSKTMDMASISLTLSDEIVDFYADNVAFKDTIIADVSYEGLFSPPVLDVEGDTITLSETNNAQIPTSYLLDKDSIVIKAFSSKVHYSTVSKNVKKLKKNLVLAIGTDANSFNIASDGTVQPSYITIKNNTTGLSDNTKVSLMVAGGIQQFDENKEFKIYPEMVSGRYIVVTISYGNERSSMHILKTFDGSGEEVEYAKSNSFTIYPDGNYPLIFNDEGLVYNGNLYVWVVPWSKNMPVLLPNEYIWRRSRPNAESPWSYARLTGAEGQQGADGKPGAILDAYLGACQEPPKTKLDGSPLENNCFYLDISNTKEPLPYKYKDGKWELINTDDPSWSYVASATQGDVNKYCNELLSTSAYYGYFQMLAAQKAYLKSLGAQEIVLNENGVIKSENWDKTDGAEGWMIEADGDANFNTGTWRGAFANGLSFIPPVKTSIDKNMTQKEAYQKLKKAGLSSGYYMTEYAKAHGGSDQEQGAEGIFNPMGFRCFDYDAEKISMNIPHDIGLTLEKLPPEADQYSRNIYIYNSIFGYVGYIAPLTVDSWIMAKFKKTADGNNVEVDKFYILTLENLQKAYERKESVTNTSMPDYSDLLIPVNCAYFNTINPETKDYYEVALDSIFTFATSLQPYEKEYKSFVNLIAPFSYIFQDKGKTKIFSAVQNQGNSSFLVSLLEYDETSHRLFVKAISDKGMADDSIGVSLMTLDGKDVVGNYGFYFVILPTIQVHKIADKYQIFALGPVGVGGYNVLETTDFIHFTTVAKIPIDLAERLNMNGYPFYPMAINKKVYFIYTHVENPDIERDLDPYRFYCYDTEADTFECIPNQSSYAGVKYSNEVDTPSSAHIFGKLVYAKGVIYGTLYYPGYSNIFSYNTQSGEYKDLTKKVIDAISITEGYLGHYGDFSLYNRMLRRANPLSPDGTRYASSVIYTKAEFLDMCYDEAKDAIFLQVKMLSMCFNVYMDLNTQEISLFSPFYAMGLVYSYNSTSGYINDGKRINFVSGFKLFTGGQKISFPPFEMRNYSPIEYGALINSGTAKQSEKQGFIGDTINYIQRQIYAYPDTMYADWLDPRYITSCSYDDTARTFSFTDKDRFTCSAVHPIKGIYEIIIEEDGEEYRICLAAGFGTGYWTPLMQIERGSLDGVYRCSPNARIEPFLRIKKNSLEPVGATCYFDFPAQITSNFGIDIIYARNLYPRVTSY